MFKKLNNRLKWSLRLMMFIMIFFVCFIAGIITHNNMYQNFMRITQQDIQLAHNNIELYMDLVFNAADAFVHDDEVHNLIDSNDFYTFPIHKMNLLRDQTNAMGTTLYVENTHNVKRSSNIGQFGFVSWNQLSSISTVENFIMQDQISYISYRTQMIHNAYGTNNYPSSSGVITHIHKIQTAQGNRGYLTIDINPDNIMGFYNHTWPDDIISYIKDSSGTVFKYPTGITINHFSNIVIETAIDDQALLITVIPAWNYYSDLSVLLLSLVILSTIFIILSVKLSTHIAYTITRKLEYLQTRMNHNQKSI